MKKIKPGEAFQMGNQIWEYSLKEGNVAIKVVKDIDIKKKDKIFIPPTMDEVKAFWNEEGYNSVGAEQAFKYYSELEWHDGRGTPIKSWKAKMRVNWFRDQYRLPVQTQKTDDPTNGVIM